MSIIKWSGKIKCVALIVPISIMIVIILLLAKDTLKDNYEVIFADAFYCNSCYVTKKGELYFVGLNADNVYSESSIVTKPIKINTGQSIVKKAVCSLNSILYLDEKGDVYIVGSYKTQSGKSKQTDVPVKIEGLSNIVDIAAGEMHYMALNNDGIVWSWGKNECKQVSSKIASTEYWKPYKINIQDVQKIECGYYTSCVITKNNVILWGENSFQINANERFDDYYKLNIDNAKEVSIGRNHLIIQTDKDLIGYGSNYFNQLGNDESSLLQGEIIDIELEKIDAVSCGYTSSTFLSDGRMYLLGDIDPFDGDENTDFKLIEANRTFDQITSRGFHIIAYGRDGLIFRGNNNWGQCAENIRKNKRNSVSNMIALVDTGVYWAEELLDCRGDVDVRPENKSLCNLKQGNNQIFDDVYDDSHGTAMMGLMLDCKIKNGKIYDYNREIKILPIKAINNEGGRFVDIITAFEIANMKGCKLINCSFSITDFSYESMLKFIINETNDLTYIFADENNNKEIVTVNSSKVIYITENRKLKHVNCIKVPMKKYKVLLPLDSSGIFQGTSCATAYVTGIIARKFIDDKDIINSIKNYFEENKKNEANK